jgi:endonuclease/exonuclease/phosphatase family metal-dependent hydrolase
MEPTKKLRLLSYNINFAAARKGLQATEKNVIRGIKEADAEICVLQESHKLWEKLFRDQLSEYPYTDFVDYDMSGAGGISVLSKRKLKESFVINAFESVKGSWFPIWCGAFDKLEGSGQIWIACVHLRPPLTDQGSASWSTMGDTSPIRQEELKLLLERLKPKMKEEDDIIIAGDFNETDRHSACSMLRDEHQFKDALALYGSYTHWWPMSSLFGNKRVALHSRLDHMFYSSGLTCRHCTVLEGYEGNASDHLPLVAEFTEESSQGQVDSLPFWTASSLSVSTVESGTLWSK